MISLRLGTLYVAVIILVSCGDRTPSPVVDATIEETPVSPTAIPVETLNAPTLTLTPTIVAKGSSSSGGRAHSHTDGYSDGGADQTASTSAHSHPNGFSDGGADQTANTGAHSHTNRYSDVGADQTPNTGARSHSNRYSDVGADQTANTGARSHASGLIPPPRLR